MLLRITLVVDGRSDRVLKPIIEWMLQQYLPAGAAFEVGSSAASTATLFAGGSVTLQAASNKATPMSPRKITQGTCARLSGQIASAVSRCCRVGMIPVMRMCHLAQGARIRSSLR